MKIHTINEDKISNSNKDYIVDKIYVETFSDNLYLNQVDYCNVPIGPGDYTSTVQITKIQALAILPILMDFVSSNKISSESIN